MEIHGNYHVSGSASAKTIILPEGSVLDEDIADNAAIAATKCESLQQIRYSQSQLADVADDECFAHVLRLPSEVIAVEVTPIVPPSVVTPHVVITRLQAGLAGRNEKQTLTLYGTPTGGTFRLTVTANASTQQTGTIAFNANAATVLAALEALSNIAPGDVVVTGGSLPGTAIVVEFAGTLAALDIPLMIVAAAGLTGGSIAASVNTTSGGGAGRNERQWVTPLVGTQAGFDFAETGTVSGGTFDFTIDGETVSNIPFNANPIEFLELVYAATVWSPATLNFQPSSNSGGLGGEWDDDLNLSGALFLFLGAASAESWTTSINSGSLTGGGSYNTTDTAGTGTYSLSGSLRFAFQNNTSAIAFNATQAQVQTALRALPEFTPDKITVLEWIPSECSIAVEYVNDLANQEPAHELVIAFGYLPTGATDSNHRTYLGGYGSDEVQTLTLSGAPAQGSVDVTFDGSTATLAYNSSSAAAQTALRALASINGPNVNVTGSWPGTLTVTFVGALAGQNVNQMTVDDSKVKSSVVTTQTRISPLNEKQQIAITGSIGGGTFTLSFDHGSNQTTAACAYNLSNATLDTRLEDLSNIAGGDITITLGTLPTTAVVVEFGGTLAATPLNLLTTNDAGLTPLDPTYTVDVGYVNRASTAFTSLLQDVVEIDTSSVARTPLAATIDSTLKDRHPEDILVVIVDTNGIDDIGQGLNVVIHVVSQP